MQFNVYIVNLIIQMTCCMVVTFSYVGSENHQLLLSVDMITGVGELSMSLFE